MVDLKNQYRRLKAKIDEAIKEILNSTAFINGTQVQTFCRHLADYGKDDRDDAGGDQLDRQDALDAAIAGVTMNALGVVDGDEALGFVNLRDDPSREEIEGWQ